MRPQIHQISAPIGLAPGLALCAGHADPCWPRSPPASRPPLQAAAEGLPLVLVLSKVDRLIVELKLPPADAYHK